MKASLAIASIFPVEGSMTMHIPPHLPRARDRLLRVFQRSFCMSNYCQVHGRLPLWGSLLGKADFRVGVVAVGGKDRPAVFAFKYRSKKNSTASKSAPSFPWYPSPLRHFPVGVHSLDVRITPGGNPARHAFCKTHLRLKTLRGLSRPWQGRVLLLSRIFPSRTRGRPQKANTPSVMAAVFLSLFPR